MKIMGALLYSSAGQYVTSILTLVKILVISRLLGPEEIGVFAIAMSIIFFAQTLRTVGIGEYIISLKEVHEAELRTCFTILICMSSAFAVLFWVLAAPTAAFFDAPALEDLLKLLTAYFFISPLGMITQAQFYRAMRFKELAAIQVATAVADVILVIGFAIYGFGPLSLVFGYIGGGLAALATICWFDRKTILFRPLFKGVGKIARFGVPLTFSTMLNQTGVFAPALIVGHSIGAAATGYFNRGQAPVTFFRQAIEQSTARVALAWFAKISRDDPASLRTAYIKSTSVSAGIAWPFYTVLFFHAPTIVPLLLGEQWHASVPIAQALAVGGVMSTYTLYGLNLLAGAGRADLQLQFNIVAQTIRFSLLLFAVSHGLEAFAWAYAASNFVAPALICIWLRKGIGLRFRDLARSMARSFLVTLALAALNYLALTYYFQTAALDLLQLTLILAVNGTVWLAAIAVVRHELLVETFRIIKNRRQKSAAA